MLHIVSASYGPCEGRRRRRRRSDGLISPQAKLQPAELQVRRTKRRPDNEEDGEDDDDSSANTTSIISSLADTRDVTSFVRALLILQYQRDEAQQEHYHQHFHYSNEAWNHNCNNQLKGESTTHFSKVPSNTQSLHISPSIPLHCKSCVKDRNIDISNGLVPIDAFRTKSGMKRAILPLMEGKTMNEVFGDPCPGTSKKLEVHYQQVLDETSTFTLKQSRRTLDFYESFAEHERVVLRLSINCSKLEGHNILRVHDNQAHPAVKQSETIEGMHQQQEQQQAWQQLPFTVWEIILPMVLPFLEIRERVSGRLVHRLWQKVVRDRGVAQSIDWTDRDEFPNHTFTCTMLRGLLRHSYWSLSSLYLANLQELTHDDLAPAIPNLRRLRSLDVSGCYQLDNMTLQLLSQHVNATLHVLYLKSLSKVTDTGIVAVCRSCHQLRVLDISNLHPLTDEGAGMAIGENLTQLRALYLRDNYLLTNRSIDIITEKCTQLTQLTLWGCIKLQHLSLEHQQREHDLLHRSRCGNLVVLNLWGCHNLRNEASFALGKIKNLRSLIVSECHRLTDQFLIGLTQNTPQLNHLHLRYCKKLTDSGVNAIAAGMNNLYSLDLSFCTRVNMASIIALLETRRNTLSELRLQSCRQLAIFVPTSNERSLETERAGQDGQALLDVLRESNSCLNLLDLRGCGQPNIHEAYPQTDSFVQGMERLLFHQRVPGFFARPATWSPNVQLRLCDLLGDKTHGEMNDM